MNRFLSILLLTSFIWIQTPVAQVLKIYTLIEHYYEHKADNNDLSIGGFLHIHYAHRALDKPTHNRDTQLPFKQSNPIPPIIGFIQHSEFDLPPKLVHPDFTKPVSQYRFPHNSVGFFHKIWQPPRV